MIGAMPFNLSSRCHIYEFTSFPCLGHSIVYGLRIWAASESIPSTATAQNLFCGGVVRGLDQQAWFSAIMVKPQLPDNTTISKTIDI